MVQSNIKAMLDSLQSAALHENWEEVDKILPFVCNEAPVLLWAAENAKSSDHGLRDLAVSIFERSSHALSAENIDMLTALMHSDTNPFVRFRSAFALFSHGKRTEDVIAIVRQATTEPDVAEPARNYLKELEA